VPRATRDHETARVGELAARGRHPRAARPCSESGGRPGRYHARVTRLLSLGLIAVMACSSKAKEKEEPREPDLPPLEVPGDMPPEMARWMPPEAERAWQGGWISYVHLSPLQREGTDVALQIKGDELTAFDGKEERKMTFAVIAPCIAELTRNGERSEKHRVLITATISREIEFAIVRGALVPGHGWVGYRRGKAAIACRGNSSSGAVYTLDERGTCTRWEQWPRTSPWLGKPAACRWMEADGKPRLVIAHDKDEIALDAVDDLLQDEPFRDFVARYPHTRTATFVEAKVAVATPR
jgi:hypothetical protein